MRHMDLIEIHDHRLFPTFLRDLFTDALEAMWTFSSSYKPILPRLQQAMSATGTLQVLDLCSGAGGPWPRLTRDMASTNQPPLHIRLTDKYPNVDAFKHASNGLISYEPDSVDAALVPSSLTGFRTIFSSFHHLTPVEARNTLRHAVSAGQGIGVFELARRAPRTIFVMSAIPLLILFLTPRIRPFRWSRLLFTYLLPIIPFVVWFDGLVSCLRAYSQDELAEMVVGITDNTYRWDIGEECSGFLPVTYLIGHPNPTPMPPHPIN